MRGLVQVETATMLLLDSFGQELIVTAARGIEGTVHQGGRVPVGRGFAGRVAAEKQPVIIERSVTPTSFIQSLPSMGSARCSDATIKQRNAYRCAPCWDLVPRRFTDDDVRLIQIAAEWVAVATQSGLAQWNGLRRRCFSAVCCRRGYR